VKDGTEKDSASCHVIYPHERERERSMHGEMVKGEAQENNLLNFITSIYSTTPSSKPASLLYTRRVSPIFFAVCAPPF